MPPRWVEQPVSRKLARSASVIALATVTSRVLGLVRDQVLAYYFGAGDAMDAFRIAFRLPNVLRDLFAEGAMSAALVPAFTRAVMLEGRQRVWSLGNNTINLMALVTGAIATAGIVFARPLVDFYAGEFSRVPGKLELTLLLTRIMFPFLTLVAVAAVLMAMLNALHRFFVPALAPAMFNVATILMAWLLVPRAPAIGISPIVIVAIGTLVGGVGQVLLQWPALSRQGFRYRPTLDVSDPALWQITRLMGPGVGGLAAVQVNLFVNTWLATSLGTGAVSWLDYAFRLMYMPIGLFGISIATAALPGISRHAAARDDAAVREAVSSGLRMMLAVNVPATAGLIALATPIVMVIFEHGRFTHGDAVATAAALTYYAPGLVGYSAVKLISPVFYALGTSRLPVMASAASVAVNITLSLMLVRTLGHRGLALGTAISALANAAILLVMLRRRLGGIEGRQLITTFVKITIASLVMAGAVHGTESLLHMYWAGEALAVRAIRVFTSICVGLAVLTATAVILRIHEFTDSIHALTIGVRPTPNDQ
jgi:putative peptidoglycan lipid II flippase